VRFLASNLAGAWLVEPEPREDERGAFARTMCRRELAAHGLPHDFVQQNMSVSHKAGTLRGMHWQEPPHAECKLIRCVRGRILDVIIDLRRDSATYLQHARMVFVPEGFAHGFQTLSDDVEVTYLVTQYYEPSAEAGIRYCDPAVGIHWPLPVTSISPKDQAWPLLGDR
jgi:dTDP-4-dehydrorhamnose 3,5-epimerase